jgi:hypothetical protein
MGDVKLLSTFIGTVLVVVLLYIVACLIETINEQKKQIRQMQMRKRWDDFSYRLLETQLLVRDAIDISREFTNTCEKYLKDTEGK